MSFRVASGELVGFLGPNGAGKSTTLRTIVGFIGPSAGRVRVAGHDVVEEPLLARRAVGYMPESAALYPEMRVQEYLRFRCRLKGLPRREHRTLVGDALERSEVGDVGGRRIGTLSRGYRQRVALADALLGRPPLLVLDEPTAGLDPNQIRAVRKLLRGLKGEHTVLLSTHILSEVESVCDRAVVVDRGRLVAEGPLGSLTQRKGGSRSARLEVHDAKHCALGVLLEQEAVLNVETESERSAEDVLHLLVTFEASEEPEKHMEGIVRRLVHSNVGVRQARVLDTSLEDVFRQLTLGTRP